MIEVVVEYLNKSTVRIIKIGIQKKQISTYKEVFVGIICSQQIFAYTGSDKETRKSRCWKTTKHGNPHAKRSWQRHLNRTPSKRRNRWGKVRNHISPSVRILNDSSRCIYPNINNK